MKVNNDNLQKSIAYTMDSENDDYEKKKMALAKKLGDNPIAKKIEANIDRMDKIDERYEEWESIQCIMSAARDVYMESGDFKKTIESLKDALSKISESDVKEEKDE